MDQIDEYEQILRDQTDRMGDMAGDMRCKKCRTANKILIDPMEKGFGCRITCQHFPGGSKVITYRYENQSPYIPWDVEQTTNGGSLLCDNCYKRGSRACWCHHRVNIIDPIPTDPEQEERAKAYLKWHAEQLNLMDEEKK